MSDPKALIHAYLDDELTEEQRRALVAWVRQASDHRMRFIAECCFHSQLQDVLAGEQARDYVNAFQTSCNESVPPPFPVACELFNDVRPVHGIAFAGGAFLGPAGYLSAWPAAYLIATVIFGIGLLIGAVTHVSHPVQVARESATIHYPLSTIHSSMVGRITGMVDCRWADESMAAINGSYVSLGRKYALRSGLMEITYDTGAKVVLQGPATYEVESNAGGYLSLGKLTARVEGKAESGKRKAEKVRRGHGLVAGKSPNLQISKSQIPNPPLSTIHYPLFTIKTPTAVVTDLSTEFGVEVGEEGSTVSHVFQGAVEVQLSDGDGRLDGRAIRLTENESLRIERRKDDGKLTAQRIASDPSAFVRAEQLPALAREQVLEPLRRWQAYGEQLRSDPALVAHYTFESPAASRAMLPNRSAAGSALDGQITGAEWVSGRLPGKYALYFHGPGSGDRVVLPEQQRFKFAGPFSIAVWFRVARFSERYQPLVAKGGDSWRLERDEDTNAITFDNHIAPAPASGDPWQITNGQTSVNDLRWHLAVAVYEPAGEAAKTRLYIDGRLDAENESPLSLGQNDDPVWIGSHSVTANCEFQGHIDEVAIFGRALSADEAAAMFEAGRPARQTKDK